MSRDDIWDHLERKLNRVRAELVRRMEAAGCTPEEIGRTLTELEEHAEKDEGEPV